MRAGNATYLKAEDLPQTVPVFPLSGALLLPGGQMPLNIFEPRYLTMIEDALCSERLIGMIQPRFDAPSGARRGLGRIKPDSDSKPALCEMGCIGRITAFQECGDGRYAINLTGVCRYRVVRERKCASGYRRCDVAPFAADLCGDDDGSTVDRNALLDCFRKYLEANGMEADWEAVRRSGNETLVTALCMMSPYGPAEKQALLEASDLRTRAETLIAITEIALARGSGDAGSMIQ